MRGWIGGCMDIWMMGGEKRPGFAGSGQAHFKAFQGYSRGDFLFWVAGPPKDGTPNGNGSSAAT